MARDTATIIEVETGPGAAGIPEETRAETPPANGAETGDTSATLFPLSFAQEGVWFFEQMAPGTATYNIPEAWRLSGPLNLVALQRSLDEIIRRHDALRTVFGAKGGIPVQLVLPPRSLSISVTDLRQEADKEMEAQRLLGEMARTPFDLTLWPLARVTVIRLADDDHILAVNLHHIIADAWSVGVLLTELAALYGAEIAGQAATLPELPIRYGDFVMWQREVSRGEPMREDLRYWEKQLRGPLPRLALPVDGPRPEAVTFRGAAHFVTLPTALAAGVRELSQREGATAFRVLLAAFKILLQRYAQQDDIVVGSPFAGRQEIETEGLIGFFVNTLALRTDLGGDPTFRELLGRVRGVTLGASSHQAVPLKLVVKALGTERQLDMHPIFQVAFGFQEDFTEDWSLPGLKAARLELESGTAKFDWTMLVTETKNALRLRFEYNTDRFEAATVARVSRQFQRLIEEIVAAPHRRISEYSLLDPAERRQLLALGCPPAVAYERDRCVHELFEAQALKTPAADAVVFNGQSLTYRGLNEKADQLAQRLRTEGLGPGMVAGLCLERSADMVAAMLAILKTGAAYLPLDWAYPKERLAFMLDDTDATLVVTQRKLQENLWGTAPRIVCIDDASPAAAETETPRFTQRNIRATDTAYIAYTSGSTGQPKGVAVTHRGIVRLVRNPGYLEISAEDVFLQLAPLSFDASTFEIWGPLLNGAKLAIAPAQVLSLEELGRTVRHNRVTTLWLTAGLFNQMVDWQLGSLQGLRHLLAGGEALSPAHVLKAVRELENCQLINGYGPTEGTTFTCCHRVPADWPGGRSVPIGRPVANTRVYVLDSRREPVPVGIPGELYLGGDGLANGYVSQPELMAGKFVNVTWENGAAPERLYRTGDLVRWLADGTIEFIGRMDGQLKIRGFRVEPGEVEAALLRHPAVREAVVMARADRSGTQQLAAYLVLRSEVADAAELRGFLATQLPPFMMPAHFVPLKELPLTANGKVDRNALPQLEPYQSAAVDRIAPRNPTEALVAQIWCEVLGCEAVGVHDNFFHAGGHSLLATQIISRMARASGIELPMRTLFETPTVEGLARALNTAKSTGTEQPAAISRRETPLAAEALLARLDELSDREVEELLIEFGES